MNTEENKKWPWAPSTCFCICLLYFSISCFLLTSHFLCVFRASQDTPLSTAATTAAQGGALAGAGTELQPVLGEPRMWATSLGPSPDPTTDLSGGWFPRLVSRLGASKLWPRDSVVGDAEETCPSPAATPSPLPRCPASQATTGLNEKRSGGCAAKALPAPSLSTHLGPQWERNCSWGRFVPTVFKPFP